MIGKYKIFIIDEVHMITNQAFNALLKTLEEPPPHVIFIFATTEANKIPQTILSRVQRFDFKRLSITQIIDRLKFICQEEGISTDMEALSVLAEKADGSMRDALTYFDQAYAFTGNQMDAKSVRSILGLPQNEIYFTLLSAIEKHYIASCFQQVEKAASVGIEYAPYLDGFAKFLRNALYIRVGAGTPEVLNISQELHEQFSSASRSFTNGDLLRISKIVTDTIGALRYSSNPRLLVETALARMAWLDHLTDLRKVLSTLQSPNSGEIKKKLATLPPKEQSLEDLNIFDSLEENVPPPPSSQDFIFLENESPTLFFSENLEQDWNIVLEQLLLEGEKSLYKALHETKVFIENPKANPIHLTIAFPLQKDGSFVWDSTIFISSDKSRQKFTSWLEKKLNLSVFLETTSYTPETEELSKKQRISAYEEDLIHEPGLKLLHDLFTIECLNSKKLHQIE
jgi:DNA polymerase-3 subunit gamma/tau